MSEEPSERVVEAVVRAILDTPLGDLVQLEELAALGTVAPDPDGVAWIYRAVVRPTLDRLWADVEATTDPLGRWMAEPWRAALVTWLAAPKPVPKAIVEELATNALIGRELRGLLRGAVAAYAERARAATPLRDAFGRGARVLGAARGLLGGLGEEVRKQIQTRLEEFVEDSVDLLQERAARRLLDPEVARDLGREGATRFGVLLDQSESSIAKAVAAAVTAAPSLPTLVEPAIPAAAVHAARHPRWSARWRIVMESWHGVRDETAGHILDRLGLRSAAESVLRAHVRAVVRHISGLTLEPPPSNRSDTES